MIDRLDRNDRKTRAVITLGTPRSAPREVRERDLRALVRLVTFERKFSQAAARRYRLTLWVLAQIRGAS